MKKLIFNFIIILILFTFSIFSQDYFVSTSNDLYLNNLTAYYSGNAFFDTGNYSVIFDGTNLASGIYFYKIETLNSTITKKILLVK